MTGDVWDLHANGAWVVIPTNQQTRHDGTAVMGVGLARQAADRFPGLDEDYGIALKRGDVCVAYAARRLLCVPTKRHWKDKSHLADIGHVVGRLRQWAKRNTPDTVAVPALGCGYGGLAWDDVEPLLDTLPQPPFVVLAPQPSSSDRSSTAP